MELETSMRRRQLLATTGVCCLGGIAGCLGDDEGVEPPEDDQEADPPKDGEEADQPEDDGGDCPDKYEWCYSVAADVSAVTQGLLLGIEEFDGGPPGVEPEDPQELDEDFDGGVFALDIETGDEQWTYGAEKTGEGYEMFHDFYVDDQIYALWRTDGMSGEIHALTREGEQNWVAGTGRAVQEIETTPDVMYISTWGTGVGAYEKSSGERRWQYSQGNDNIGGENIALDDGMLYAVDPELQALDPSDGSVTWAYGSEFDRVRSGIVADSVAYVGWMDGTGMDGIAAVVEGEERWRAEAYQPDILAVLSDLVLAQSESAVLQAFDRETGGERWRCELPDANLRQIAHGDTTVYLLLAKSSDESRLMAVDLSDGEVKWNRDGQRVLRLTSDGQTTGHELYTARDETTLERLTPDGEVTWSESVEGPIQPGQLFVDDLIVAGTEEGAYALDAS